MVLLGQKFIYHSQIKTPFPLLATMYGPARFFQKRTPELWREAEELLYSPIFLGLFFHKALMAVRYLLYGIGIRGIGSNERTTSGIWNLESGTRKTAKWNPVTLRSLVDGWTDYAANAWIQLWPGRIGAWPNVDARLTFRLVRHVQSATSVVRTNNDSQNERNCTESGYRGTISSGSISRTRALGRLL